MPRAATVLAEAFPAYALRPVTGVIEMAVAEAVTRGSDRPSRATAVLTAVLEEVAGQPSSPGLMRRLSAGSREWLLQQASAAFRPREGWFQAACAGCGERYDLSLDLADLPRKAAGKGFPVVAVQTSRGTRRFEAPHGGHEEGLARSGLTGEAARRWLVAACGLDDHAEAFARDASVQDLDAVDAALEAAAPDVADEVGCVCPACGAETTARLDPLSFGFPRGAGLLREVHDIAGAYHWPEGEILALPMGRRRSYLAMIRDERRARGGAAR